jgi:hypothetical protein
LVDDTDLDEYGGVVVEVLDREHPVDAGGEYAFLLVQIGGVDGENRIGRRCLVAEVLDVSLAERAEPGDSLATYRPGGVPVVLALGHLGQLAHDACEVLRRCYPWSVDVGAARLRPMRTARRTDCSRAEPTLARADGQGGRLVLPFGDHEPHGGPAGAAFGRG